MAHDIEAARLAAAGGRLETAEQETRIAELRALLVALEQDGDEAVIGEARQRLEELERAFIDLKADAATAERRLQQAEDPLDEASLEDVMRKSPL